MFFYSHSCTFSTAEQLTDTDKYSLLTFIVGTTEACNETVHSPFLYAPTAHLDLACVIHSQRFKNKSKNVSM